MITVGDLTVLRSERIVTVRSRLGVEKKALAEPFLFWDEPPAQDGEERYSAEYNGGLAENDEN